MTNIFTNPEMNDLRMSEKARPLFDAVVRRGRGRAELKGVPGGIRGGDLADGRPRDGDGFIVGVDKDDSLVVHRFKFPGRYQGRFLGLLFWGGEAYPCV